MPGKFIHSKFSRKVSTTKLNMRKIQHFGYPRNFLHTKFSPLKVGWNLFKANIYQFIDSSSSSPDSDDTFLFVSWLSVFILWFLFSESSGKNIISKKK